MGAFRDMRLWLYLMLLCIGLGMWSLLQVGKIMEQDQLERMRHRRWRLEARAWGFGEREGWYLAFWRWLASQRGETRNRKVQAEGLALNSWKYGLRVDE
jgi:hypothetical protein